MFTMLEADAAGKSDASTPMSERERSQTLAGFASLLAAFATLAALGALVALPHLGALATLGTSLVVAPIAQGGPGVHDTSMYEGRYVGDGLGVGLLLENFGDDRVALLVPLLAQLSEQEELLRCTCAEAMLQVHMRFIRQSCARGW